MFCILCARPSVNVKLKSIFCMWSFDMHQGKEICFVTLSSGPSPVKLEKPKITHPHTPQLLTRQRSRPVMVKSSAEIEAEETEKLQQYVAQDSFPWCRKTFVIQSKSSAEVSWGIWSGLPSGLSSKLWSSIARSWKEPWCQRSLFLKKRLVLRAFSWRWRNVCRSAMLPKRQQSQMTTPFTPDPYRLESWKKWW